MADQESAADISYNSYLKVGELLQLQQRRTDHHDEMQFIVIHQVYELWFRLTLFELDEARSCLLKDDPDGAVHLIGRVNEIFRILINQLDIIETMRPQDFLQFRDVLKPASGFQSVQYRELEYLAGAKDPRFLGMFGTDPAAERLRRRLGEPSLWDAFLALLRGRGLAVDPEPELKRTLISIESGHDGPALRAAADGLVEFDSRVAQWRHRHIMMTERMIGNRPGTGEKLFQKLQESGYSAMGTGGVHYLETTLRKRFFPLLWEARAELVK